MSPIDHLPLYRQAQIYSRQGVDLDRSTLADWVGRAAWHLRPVYERLLVHICSSPKIFADETTAPVLDPGRGRTKTGQLWAYARDDRPWGGTDPPAVAYVYAPDRKSERPQAHLADFAGVLQVDGYAGYRALAGNRVQLAFCGAHVRRRFYELAAAGPAPIASEALARIGALYAIEDEIRGRDPETRGMARQQRSRPIVDALEPWLREKLGTISQKIKLAEAIRYALSRWEGLTRYIDKGRIEIDSNRGRARDPSGAAGVAGGAALSTKTSRREVADVCFFSDGALGQRLIDRINQHGRAVEAASHLWINSAIRRRDGAMSFSASPAVRAQARRVGIDLVSGQRPRPRYADP